jgi:hypothetical protein
MLKKLDYTRKPILYSSEAWRIPLLVFGIMRCDDE